VVDLNQVRVTWSGFAGQPGVSTFYGAGGASDTVNAVKAFFDAIKGTIPAAVTLTFPGNGSIIDSASGLAKGIWTATTPSPVACIGTGGWAAPVGAVVNWRTALWLNGRQVRGKTFIVPLTSQVYETDGTIASVTLGTLRTAASTLVSSLGMFHVRTPSTGGSAPITSADVPDKVIVLRSRRT